MTPTKAFTVTVRGTPRPQPRPRPAKHGRRRMVSTMDPKAKLWRLAIERAVKAALPDEPLPLFRGAAKLTTIFTFEPPGSARDRMGLPHTQKPDASNLLKLVEDVLENCGVFDNDSKVAKPVPEKWWGSPAGLIIMVETCDGDRRSIPAPAAPPDWLR